MSRPVIIGGRDVSEHIQRNLARAGKPTGEQIARLRMLFAPVTAAASTPPAAPRRAPARPHTRTSPDVAAQAA